MRLAASVIGTDRVSRTVSLHGFWLRDDRACSSSNEAVLVSSATARIPSQREEMSGNSASGMQAPECEGRESRTIHDAGYQATSE